MRGSLALWVKSAVPGATFSVFLKPLAPPYLVDHGAKVIAGLQALLKPFDNICCRTMPAPKSFGRDHGLQIRMLATTFLLGLIYVVLIAVLIAAGAGAITVAVIAGGAVPGPVLHLRQARPVLDGRPRGLARGGPSSTPTIERLCIPAQPPEPRIAIADTPMPNAFAVGRSPEHRHGVRHRQGCCDCSPGRARGRPGPRAHPRSRPATCRAMTIASFFAVDRGVHRPDGVLVRRRHWRQRP